MTAYDAIDLRASAAALLCADRARRREEYELVPKPRGIAVAACPLARVSSRTVCPQADLDAERHRRRRRSFQHGLQQAAARADDDELDELERLVRLERLGHLRLRDAHAAVLDLLRAQRERT